MTKKKGENFQKRMNMYSTFGRVFVYENWQVAVVLVNPIKKTHLFSGIVGVI